jgi:thiol:disulfide interchange protein
MKFRVFCSVLAVTFLGLIAGSYAGDSTASKPAIYDTKADGFKQIDEALKTAARDHKHVLLQFGANWCSWCHKLHELCAADKDIAKELADHYVVVLIDVDKHHNETVDLKYGHPMKLGLPVIVVLDSEGKKLTTKDSGELEEGKGHNPQKVLAFLKAWAPHDKA